jgi:hypothetical protein
MNYSNGQGRLGEEFRGNSSINAGAFVSGSLPRRNAVKKPLAISNGQTIGTSA